MARSTGTWITAEDNAGTPVVVSLDTIEMMQPDINQPGFVYMPGLGNSVRFGDDSTVEDALARIARLTDATDGATYEA